MSPWVSLFPCVTRSNDPSYDLVRSTDGHGHMGISSGSGSQSAPSFPLTCQPGPPLRSPRVICVHGLPAAVGAQPVQLWVAALLRGSLLSSAPVPFRASSTPLPSLLPSSSGLSGCPVQIGCLAIFLSSPISRDQAPPLGEVMPHECCPGQFVSCPPASRLQVQLLAKQPVVETGAGSWAAALHHQPGQCWLSSPRRPGNRGREDHTLPEVRGPQMRRVSSMQSPSSSFLTEP